jgi:hypothetical protein
VYSVHRNHIEWLCGITPPHTKSHQLRTRNERSYINSVPWLYAVTSTPYHEWMWSHQLRDMNDRGQTNSVPYHEWTQFVDSVKSLSFSIIREFFGDQLRTFMVWSWCDSVHSWYRVNAIFHQLFWIQAQEVLTWKCTWDCIRRGERRRAPGCSAPCTLSQRNLQKKMAAVSKTFRSNIKKKKLKEMLNCQYHLFYEAGTNKGSHTVHRKIWRSRLYM